MNDQSDPQNELSRVLKKICEIAEKSADGDYIFRGETELHEEKPYYGTVSSNLCREYLDDIEEESFEIEFVQEEILDEAKKYSDKEDFEILTELQHYGSKTNLIDFTTDYLIALFFACDGSTRKDGRVILQKRSSVESFLEHPREPRNRVMAQKSIFVRPPRGYIKPDVVVTIESYLKQPILVVCHNYLDS
ncbi:MAG: FRG domain-containing protein [Candidatus Poribacteria bacterium]|nr:FRG domain-containing protein [Candidatus Poribacteria bacterium]